MKADELVKWAVLGGITFLAYEIFSKISSVGKTAGDVGNQVGELGDFTADPNGQTFVSWYDPTQRTVFFYWLTFPDGHHHMVWNSDVQPDGTFMTDDGEVYRIGNDRAGGLRAYTYTGG